MKLQVNNSGAWKHVATFDAGRRGQVIAATIRMARALDAHRVRWSIVGDDGKREWLGTLYDATAARSHQ
jgi:hypothetical protein